MNRIVLLMLLIACSCYAENIDPYEDGSQYGYGENIGWVHLASSSPVAYKVQTCVVTLDDLANFLADWMLSGSVPGNLDFTGDVDVKDFNILSQVWLDYCPDGWLLK